MGGGGVSFWGVCILPKKSTSYTKALLAKRCSEAEVNRKTPEKPRELVLTHGWGVQGAGGVSSGDCQPDTTVQAGGPQAAALCKGSLRSPQKELPCQEVHMFICLETKNTTRPGSIRTSVQASLDNIWGGVGSSPGFSCVHRACPPTCRRVKATRQLCSSTAVRGLILSFGIDCSSVSALSRVKSPVKQKQENIDLA